MQRVTIPKLKVSATFNGFWEEILHFYVSSSTAQIIINISSPINPETYHRMTFYSVEEEIF